MRALEEMKSTPRLLLMLLVAAIGLTLIATGLTTSAGFNPYNMGWDGTSELRSTADDADLEVSIGREAKAYDSIQADQAVAFILAPEDRYTDAEASRISTFLEEGGRVVIGAERTSKTNHLLSQLGVTARVRTHTLRDEKEYYKAPELPLAQVDDGSPFTEEVDEITMNIGSAVEANDATVLARSSEFAYLDANENGELETDERVEQVPVVVRENVGNGEVILAGDSSIFINRMVDRPGNRQFAVNLLSGRSSFLLDVSNSAVIPPIVKALLIIRESSLIQALLVSIGIIGILAWSNEVLHNKLPISATRVGRRSAPGSPATPKGVDTESLIQYLQSSHPDWDAQRVERVVKEIKRERNKNHNQ